MRIVWIVGLMVLTAGRSTILANNATAQLRADCESKGLQLVETETETKELLIVSSARVSGICVGPGDPRYVEPMAKAAK